MAHGLCLQTTILSYVILTRKGLLDTIGAAIACPKGVSIGLAWPKAGNALPEKQVH